MALLPFTRVLPACVIPEPMIDSAARVIAWQSGAEVAGR